MYTYVLICSYSRLSQVSETDPWIAAMLCCCWLGGRKVIRPVNNLLLRIDPLPSQTTYAAASPRL